MLRLEDEQEVTDFVAPTLKVNQVFITGLADARYFRQKFSLHMLRVTREPLHSHFHA